MEAQIILWIWGFHILFSDGMIFEGLGKLLERSLGTKVCMPIFLCPICMSSIHGGIYYLIKYQFDLSIFVFMVSISAVNYFISLIVNKLEYE